MITAVTERLGHQSVPTLYRAAAAAGNDIYPFLSVCPDQYEQHTVHDENEYIPLSDSGKMQWHFKGEEA